MLTAVKNFREKTSSKTRCARIIDLPHTVYCIFIIVFWFRFTRCLRPSLLPKMTSLRFDSLIEWVSLQRPTFPRGTWCTTGAANKGRCYHLAPSKGTYLGLGPYLGPRGTYLGPVHGMDYTPRLAAVLVPHPKDVRRLVWVNVWSSENDSGESASVFFCRAVHPKEVARWKRAGWEDGFQDVPP